MKNGSKPILCLDFDGVIHSYASGWKGAAVIPDPPIPGALRFIADALSFYTVAIHSSRSHQWGGKRAMRRYLLRHYLALCETPEHTPDWLYRHIDAFADPWPDEIAHSMRALVGRIAFPWFKPPAFVTIDDRAVQFSGTFPDPEELLTFKPWNKRRV